MSKKKQRTEAVQHAVIANKLKSKAPAPLSGIHSKVIWLIALVIILPALYSSATQDPLICIRYIFLSGFLLLFAGWFFLYRRDVSAVSIPLPVRLVFATALAFGIWMVVTMFTAINYREGIYEIARYLLNLLLLFVVMVTVITEESGIMKLFKALALVAIFQSLVGIAQYYGIISSGLPGDNDKPFGLMANRNLFASALMLLFPFVLYVLYNGNKVWKIIAAVAAGFIIWALLLSQTRADWVATVVILLTSLILVLIFSKTNRRKWLMGTSIMVAASALLIFLALAIDSGGKLRQSVAERVMSFAHRGITNDKNKWNAEERLRFWQKTLLLIKDKPVTGCGAGNWKIAIPAYGSEGMIESYGKYAPDRAHNVYLQLAAEDGLPGALFYFGMWLLIARIGFKIILRPKNEGQRILIILMLAGLAGLSADAMFSFPTERIEHSLFMYIMAGIIIGNYTLNNLNGEKLSLSKPVYLVFVAVCLVNIFIGITKYKFEEHWMLASAYEKNGRYPEMLEAAEQGKSSFVTLGPGGFPLELKTAAALQEMKQYEPALQEIDKGIKYNPNSSLLWNYRGAIHARMRQYDAALADFQQGRKLTPHFDKLLKNLAMDYFFLKQYKECLATLNEADLQNDGYFQSIKRKVQALVANQPGAKP